MKNGKRKKAKEKTKVKVRPDKNFDVPFNNIQHNNDDWQNTICHNMVHIVDVKWLHHHDESRLQHDEGYHPSMNEASNMMPPPHTQTQVESVQQQQEQKKNHKVKHGCHWQWNKK